MAINPLSVCVCVYVLVLGRGYLSMHNFYGKIAARVCVCVCEHRPAMQTVLGLRLGLELEFVRIE